MYLRPELIESRECLVHPVAIAVTFVLLPSKKNITLEYSVMLKYTKFN